MTISMHYLSIINNFQHQILIHSIYNLYVLLAQQVPDSMHVQNRDIRQVKDIFQYNMAQRHL